MRIRRPQVRAKNAAGRVELERLPSPPRSARLSAPGVVLVAACAALIVGSLVGATTLYGHAVTSAWQSSLFASEAVPIEARVFRLQRRGGGEDRRTIAHYEYTVGGSDYRDSAELRGRDRDVYSVGSQIRIRYLPDDPSASWIEGRGPRLFPVWPAYVIPAVAIFGVAVILAVIRRQRDLLIYGRSALATIRHVDKKRSDHGSYWRVEYEWRLLSGATRKAHYNHGGKAHPAIGTTLPILYDRDNPRRQRRYPFPLVRLGRI